MQQRFDTRKYSVKDFEDWHNRGELVLQPKFQRRDVWNTKARSYLIDTIIRGKPIPKIYMRQDINPKTRRTVREIVDGQQRLRTIFNFLKDGFPVLKTHNEDHGGKHFSELDEVTQRDILKYELVVDLLQDMPDYEVYDIFARLNTYSVTLNAQELRHAQWFGEFRTSVYGLANEFLTFWKDNNIFSDRQILRMLEAEFVSELMIAMLAGILAKEKRIIDRFYKDYDEQFAKQKALEKRFRETIDTIGGILGKTLPESKYHEIRVFYPLFCAVYSLRYGLPKMDDGQHGIRPADYAKLQIALGGVDEIFEKLEAYEEELLIERDEIEAAQEEEIDPLTSGERKFHNAYIEHWVHAENRRILTRFIYELLVRALTA